MQHQSSPSVSSTAASPDGGMPPSSSQTRVTRWLVPAFSLILIGALVLAWHYTPLGQWMTVDALTQLGRRIQAWPMAPVAVIACYVLLVAIGLPVTVLVTVAAIVFGPWWGMAYAMSGMLTGALVTYGVGRLSGGLVERLVGARMQPIAYGLRTHGLAAVVFVRVVPVAPFVFVNVACGALRVGLRDYLLGSFIGLLPATIIFSLFTDRLTAAVRAPSVATVAALLAFVVLAVLAGMVIKKRALARQQRG